MNYSACLHLVTLVWRSIGWCFSCQAILSLMLLVFMVKKSHRKGRDIMSWCVRVSQFRTPLVSRNPSIICSILRVHDIIIGRRHSNSIPFWLVKWFTRAIQQIWWKQRIMIFFSGKFTHSLTRYTQFHCYKHQCFKSTPANNVGLQWYFKIFFKRYQTAIVTWFKKSEIPNFYLKPLWAVS